MKSSSRNLLLQLWDIVMVFEIKQSNLACTIKLQQQVIVATSRPLRACLWYCVAEVEQGVGLSCCWLGMASLLPRGIAANHEVQNLIPYQFQTE